MRVNGNDQECGFAGDAPDVAKLLLDLPDSLEVGRTVESVAAHEQELDEVSCNVTTSNVESAGQVWKREAVVHGHNVCYTIARVDDDTGCQTCACALSLSAGSERQHDAPCA